MWKLIILVACLTFFFLDVPQPSTLGPIFFNIWLNESLSWLTKSDIPNLDKLYNFVFALEDESRSDVNWLRNNDMIVSPDKFQAIILNKKKSHIAYTLNIDWILIKSTNTVEILGANIVHKWRIDLHISVLRAKLTI